MSPNKSLLCAGGEHFIMYELLRRGHVAALAPQGAPNIDIIVTDPNGNNLFAIQVKSRHGAAAKGGWVMSVKNQNIIGDQLFYCLVDFGEAENDYPIVYVLPSKIVAEVLSSSHHAWLSTPGKNGHHRKDNSTRKLLFDQSPAYRPNNTPYPAGWMDQYSNSWDLLGLD